MTNIEITKQSAKKWLFEISAPIWSTKGVHNDGMFVEEFNHDGSPIDKFRRLMVQARQIYSFTELGRLGWQGNWKSIVENALPHFLRGINSDDLFIHTFDSQAQIQDARLDLYNQAFGLFALGNAGDVLGCEDLFEQAVKTLEVLNTKWARDIGGYWEGEITPCPPYRQNPHMHMFEAALANYNFTKNPIWYATQKKIMTTFVGKFQQSCGAVTEYFDENWKPLDGLQGQIVEPGHCFEWAWLFDIGFETWEGVKTAEELGGFARKFGICPNRKIAINEVSTAGEIIDAKARLWPQTERLKAACARYKRTKSGEDANEIVEAYNGLEKYFATDIEGFWHDKMNPDGTFIIEPVKTSSFYHITCAISELLRV